MLLRLTLEILIWKSKKIILLEEEVLELDIGVIHPAQNGRLDIGHAKNGN